MRPTILLFDIDGTLVTAGGAGRRAIERAFAARYGRDGVFREMQFHGMTDRGIVRAGLAVVEAPADGAGLEDVITAILDAYVPLLEEEVARASGFRLHPGVGALLGALAGRPRVAIGLGTGNVRPGARVKLARAGILDYFGFGGFGSDHEDRTEILRIGALRGASRLGEALDACRVVVIGDTPRDVAAARAIGATAVAVGTSGVPAETLLASGADVAFDDLGRPAVLAAILGDGVR